MVKSATIRKKKKIRREPLTFDLKRAVAVVARADVRLAQVIRNVGPCTLQPQHLQSPFEALVEAIVYQQLTGKAAAVILGRLKQIFSGSFPKPRELLETDGSALRRAGLSAAKIAALRDLASRSLDGTVPSLNTLRRMSDDEIIERLTSVRGIGRWTVEMLLIFRLGRPDVWPAGDYGIRKGLTRLLGYNDLLTPKQVDVLGERYRPFRTVASWYLWRSLD